MNLFLNKKEKGFTLMDILISTAIVSLLSSVILFQTTEARKKSEDAQMKAESHEVSNAISLYKADHNGQAPLSVSASTGTRYIESDIEYSESMEVLVEEGYLADIPTSPSGLSYSYLVGQDGEDAVFGAELNYSSGARHKNSCDFVSEESVAIYENCQLFIDNSQYGSPACDTFSVTYPDKFCYDGTKIDFCAEFNINGDYTDGYCAPPLISFAAWPEATLCDYPSGDTFCDGSSDSDYCECI